MMRIEILNLRHKRSDFHCGNKALDDYFHHYVMQDQKRFLSTCYVLSEGEKVIGFYTLSPHQIDAEKLTLFLSKRKIGPYPIVPVYLLGRLAVDSEFKKQGVGSFLLTNALKQVKNPVFHMKHGVFVIHQSVQTDCYTRSSRIRLEQLTARGCPAL